MRRTCLWVIIYLVSAVSATQGQFLSFDQTDCRNVVTRSLNAGAKFQVALFPPSPSARPRLGPFGFGLMSARNYPTSVTFGFSPMAGGPSLPVSGGGTLGRLTKWGGFTSSNSFIGDSTIFESKFGLVGIGTDTPTSRLTVAGTIQSLSGGFQFPDGTIQTTAAVGSLLSVAHDMTLVGNGTTTSPLGVAVPLILSGSVGIPGGRGVIQATNIAENGSGVVANGGRGGEGVRAQGGDGTGGEGGDGVVANGGNGELFAGNGVVAEGGDSKDVFPGGDGVEARGGTSTGGGNGGHGVFAAGGTVFGAGNTGGIGIEAFGGSGLDGAKQGLAGKFNGDVAVSGTLSKGGGSFKIDHPLDPENRYLYHSFVESPDMKNIYDGNIVTDDDGEATVTLPEYFEALNRDFRYQLTVIGTLAQAIVAEKVKGNRFKIRTSAPGVEVSWQVTGIRQDRWADKNRIQVEVEKPERERGYYLHHEAFNQPEERGIDWARNPEMMREMKERHEHVKKQMTSNHR